MSMAAAGNGGGFRQTPQGIDYAEVRSRGASVLLLLAAALSLAAALAMVPMARSAPWGTALLWPAVAVVVFACFGLLMATLACVPPQRLCFDAHQRRLHGQVRHWLAGTRRVSFAFDSLQRPEVRAFERESQGPLHQVRIVPHGRPALLLGGFDDASEAREWCDRLAALLDAPRALR
jgi:hypothetical protein